MYNVQRTATIRAMSSCRLWKMDRFIYLDLLLRDAKAQRQRLVDFVKEQKVFSGLTAEQAAGVAELLQPVVLPAALPLLVATRVPEALLGVDFSPFEFFLIGTYLQWYEIGSHSGKPMPTVTYLPPLAPLYRLLLGDVDARNVAFHQAHHRHRNGNYGITQWLDYALGTALPVDEKEEGR